MRISRLVARAGVVSSTLAMSLWAGAAAPPVSAAGSPTVKASVYGNAGTLTVTGSNLPKNAHLAVEFSGDGLDPTDFQTDGQYYPVTSSSTGGIHKNFKVFVTSSCLVVVQVVFAHTPQDVAPPILVNTKGKGCTPATIKAQCDPGGCADPSNILVTGKNWTPGSIIHLTFLQLSPPNVLDAFATTACGTPTPGVLLKAPAGILTSTAEGPSFPAVPQTPCTGDEDYSIVFCGLGPIEVAANVDEEQYSAPSVTFDPGC